MAARESIRVMSDGGPSRPDGPTENPIRPRSGGTRGTGSRSTLVLEAIGVGRHFGGVQAVDGVDFRLFSGEVHALLGENGAGKSTLAKLLVGALEPTAGKICLHGMPLTGIGRAGTDPRFGIVFQELSLMPDLTVAENIWFGREPLTPWRTVHSSRLRTATERLIDRLGVTIASPDAQVRELSLAQRQVVEIVKVLSGPHEVVVLDEATSALSPAEVDWLLRQARELADAGVAVLFISHRMREIEQMGDRITVMRNGQTVAECARGERTSDELVAAMLNRRMEQLFPPRTVESHSTVALSVRDLHVASAVHGVSFDLHEGEILGLGGLDGQGQRELLRALCGAISSRGKIRVLDEQVSLRSPQAALRAKPGLALVPEDRKSEGLLQGRSVRDNVTLAALGRVARLGVIDDKKERSLATQSIEDLSIVCANQEQAVERLSGGNQQKVVLAKVLFSGARILLLHDPTRGVDIGTKVEIYEILQRLTKSGYAALFYSTDTSELLNLADRVAVMFDGSITSILAGDSLNEQALVAASVGVRRA